MEKIEAAAAQGRDPVAGILARLKEQIAKQSQKEALPAIWSLFSQ